MVSESIECIFDRLNNAKIVTEHVQQSDMLNVVKIATENVLLNKHCHCQQMLKCLMVLQV